MTGKRRVVVTGIGAVTPLAENANSTWQKLIAGKSGIGNITIGMNNGEITTSVTDNPCKFSNCNYINRYNGQNVCLISDDVFYIDSDNTEDRMVLYVDLTNKKFVMRYDTFMNTHIRCN